MTQHNSTKGIGRGMWLMAWLLLLVVLYLFFDRQVTEKYHPNHSLRSDQPATEVVLKRNRAGHYVAPGKINGKDVVFLLDTGATTLSIPQQVADDIGLIRGQRQRVNTANGTIEVYATTLDRVQLGGITLNSIRGNINPYMDGNTVLLGMSFMRHLEITQKGDTLTLRL